MYFEDDLQIPALVPIKNYRKQANRPQETPTTLQNQEILKVFAKEFDKMHPEQEAPKAEKVSRPPLTSEGREQIQKKFGNLQEKTSLGEGGERTGLTLGSRKEKELQKAKFMVGQMMKKIDAKNISEELYPVASETILGIISSIDREIQELKVEGERKENTLMSNPNNQHLRRQLQNLKVSIDRCVTIKQLYNQKINFRNRVSVLEKQLISLREENENIRIQMHQNQEAAVLHAQGQPCQREKELKEELTRCKIDLKKVTEVKEQLENNVADIVQSFKRLYQEADTARLIVTSRLRELQRQGKAFESDSVSSERRSVGNKEERSPKPVSQNRDLSNLEMRPVRGPRGEQEKEKGKLSLAEQIKRMRGTQRSFIKQQFKR